MTATLVELTASIVSSHAAGNELTSDELILEINKVYATLKKLETEGTPAEEASKPAAPVMTIKKAFQNDQVFCLVCGKGGFKTLTRHLKQAHDLKPGQYRKQFNIPSSQSLTAKNYSEARRQAANENNLAANLEKARAAKSAQKTEPAKIAKVAKQAKVPKAAPEAKPVQEPKPAKDAKPAVKKTRVAKAKA